jgi:hypothetical protein
MIKFLNQSLHAFEEAQDFRIDVFQNRFTTPVSWTVKDLVQIEFKSSSNKISDFTMKEDDKSYLFTFLNPNPFPREDLEKIILMRQFNQG